jgi:hypothetical protein
MPEVIVVGSPSILGTFREDQLPADATMSVEIDILSIADDNAETERLADLIEGVAGEFSPFEVLHGFSIDGVDLSTSALPTGWRGRLVKVQNANTAAPGGAVPPMRLVDLAGIMTARSGRLLHGTVWRRHTPVIVRRSQVGSRMI